MYTDTPLVSVALTESVTVTPCEVTSIKLGDIVNSLSEGGSKSFEDAFNTDISV